MDKAPAVRSPFWQSDGEPEHPIDALTAFGCRLGIVDALSADGIADAPHKVMNALGELASDFDALEKAVEHWFLVHAGPSLTGPLVQPSSREGGRP